MVICIVMSSRRMTLSPWLFGAALVGFGLHWVLTRSGQQPPVTEALASTCKEPPVWISVAMAPPCNAEGWCWVGPPPPQRVTDLQDIHVLHPKSAWAVGPDGVWHWDGTKWRTLTIEGTVSVDSGAERTVTPGRLASVWAASDDDVWVASADRELSGRQHAYHWNGCRWQPDSPPDHHDKYAQPRWKLWGLHSTDLWMTGGREIYRHQGDGWKLAHRLGGDSAYVDLSVWGHAAQLWAVGWRASSAGASSAILGFDGTAWSEVVHTQPGQYLHEVHGTASDDVWAVGKTCREHVQEWSTEYATACEAAVRRYDGSRWVQAEAPSAGSLLGVWGSGARDVWTVFSGGIFHWNGVRWGLAAPGSLRAISGSAPDDVWAVGAGVPMHWNGTDWSPGTIVADDLWGAATDDVWAVGEGMAHWNGNTWEPVLSPIKAKLRAIWGRARDDIWAAGEEGHVVHYDGEAWSQVQAPVPKLESPARRRRLTTLVGSGTSVWTSGPSMGTLHWDGRTWTATDVEVEHILALSHSAAWAVTRSHLLQWRGRRWQQVAQIPTNTIGRVTALWTTGAHDIWLAGNLGVVRWSHLRWDAARPWPSPVHPPHEGFGSRVFGRGWTDDGGRVWIRGARGTLARWDGERWTSERMGAPSSNAVFRFGDTHPPEIWAATPMGVVRRK
jgi:hypothetical protein